MVGPLMASQASALTYLRSGTDSTDTKAYLLLTVSMTCLQQVKYMTHQ